MEAQIQELEKAKGPEVIDVDAAAENAMVVFSAIEELRKDTEEGWKKLAVPLDQVIKANNASNVGLKKRDVQLARWEDIMDVMDIAIFRTIFFELLVFFTFMLLTLHFTY